MARDWPIIIGFGAVLLVVPRLVLDLLVLPRIATPQGAWWRTFLISWATSAVLVRPFGCVFAAGLTLRVNSRLSEQDFEWPDCISTGLRRAPTLWLAGLATQVLTTIGLAFFIAPGVIAILAWSVVAPVAVVEASDPLSCVPRSAALTRGHRSTILVFWIGYVVVSAVVGLVFGLGLGLATTLLPALRPYRNEFLEVFLTTPVSIFGIAGVTALYHELVEHKGGGVSDTLTAVFE